MEAAVIRGATPSWLIGSGSGSGYGYGDGSGYGYGSGYGDGSGDGSGYGDGDGDGSYWTETIPHFAKTWPKTQQQRLSELKKAGAKLCFWKSRNDGSPANGGKCAPVGVGTVHEEPGPLRDECGKGQLHATLLPASKWEGERWWIVALIGEWRGDDEKMWALKREIIGEVP